jgi:hypothetical protein
VQKICQEILTVQEVLEAGNNLTAWENPSFIELLNLHSASEVQSQLRDMISKVRFMQKFEVAVKHSLLQLFPRQVQAAKEFATFLHEFFMKANCDAHKPVASQIAELSIQLTQLNVDAWKEDLEEKKLQLSIAGVSAPSFVSILAAIETLHLARSEKYRPLRSMFQEAEEKLKRSEKKMRPQQLGILDMVFFLYKELMCNLEALSELGSEDSGLPAQVLFH